MAASASSQGNHSKQYGRYYHEPLYAGNLSMRSNGINGNTSLYRWILFVSASNREIQCSKTIKSVEYKFKNGSEIVTAPPYFLESGSLGIFQLFIIIRFKNKYFRSEVEIPYILSLNSATTVTDITHASSRQYFTTLFDYKKFEQYQNEDNQMRALSPTSFVEHMGQRLRRNLERLPTPLRFVNFSMKLPEFKSMLQSVVSSIDALNRLNIPSSIFITIGFFVVFHPLCAIDDLLPSQRCIINECNTCDIHISSRKFKNLLVKSSSHLSITFPYILSQCELHQCRNVTIVCSNILYSYRLDGCNNIHIMFNDPQQRVTFLCFESSNVTLTVKNIKYWVSHAEDEEQKEKEYVTGAMYSETKTFSVENEGERLNIRWRSDVGEARFTSRVFHPIQTIGSIR
eukprot:182947_1